MIYNGIIMLPMLSLQVSASLQIPMSYIYLVISIGSSFMLFHVGLIFWKKVGEIFIRR
jgi:TRAP-type C4-dicarboxylate transport system permease small subunit